GREGAPEEARRHGPWANLGIDLGATVAGGLFIGLSVAPTEEIPTLAAQMSPWHVLALMAFSLVVGYMIVFEAGFTRARPRPRTALIHHPSTATFVSYLVALGTAAVVLFLFDQLRAEDPVHVWLTQAVVLGLPGTIGGAAGRLVT